MFNKRQVVVVIPALNEAESIGLVIEELLALRHAVEGRVVDRVIVCDNGSEDQTAAIAQAAGAQVVAELQRGYGAACLAALAHYWRGSRDDSDIIVFVDADHSVDAGELVLLLAPFRTGAQLVVGDRNAGPQANGALSPQQRFGNWLATGLIRWIWNAPVNDLGPFRAISASALQRLRMCDQAYGWTVEMQVRAVQERIAMTEVPVTSLRRIGQSKISGTLIGSLRAGEGILGMVFGLWWRERRERIKLWWASWWARA